MDDRVQCLARLLLERRYLAAIVPEWIDVVPTSLPHYQRHPIQAVAYLFHIVAKRPVELALHVEHNSRRRLLTQGYLSFFGLNSPCRIPLALLATDVLPSLIALLAERPSPFRRTVVEQGGSVVNCPHFDYNCVLEEALGDRRAVLEYACNEYLYCLADHVRLARPLLVSALQQAQCIAASSANPNIKGAGHAALGELWRRCDDAGESDATLVRRVQLWKATHAL